MVVPELMRQHASKLGELEQLEQRQPDPHHPLSAETHPAAAFARPGIDVVDQIHLCGHRLLRRRRNVPHLLEQPRLGGEIQPRSWRLEAVPARQDGPDDHARPNHTEEHQPWMQPMRKHHLRIRNPQQPHCNPQRQQIEPDHQRDRQRRASGE